jgi:hypothetical protein
VPATPEFLRLARVTAAGLASKLGYTSDQVEHLLLAVDEMCSGLDRALMAGHGTLHLRFFMRDDGLAVEGEFHVGPGPWLN